MRTRDLKPKFFRNATLAKQTPLTRILYQGLWCMADKKGRLLDEPALIKGDCLPFDKVDVDKMLGQLAQAGFIVRYEVDGLRCIAIPTFLNHQHPHPKEPDSVLPSYTLAQCTDHGEATERQFFGRVGAV